LFFLALDHLCRIAGLDTLKASRMLNKWVERGMLMPDMTKGKRGARYGKPGQALGTESFFSLSGLSDNSLMDTQ
jgi:ATP-dependent DNA helicase RecG